MSILDLLKNDRGKEDPIENKKLLQLWQLFLKSKAGKDLWNFYDEFCLHARFLMMTVISGPAGPITDQRDVKAGARMDFATIHNKNGGLYFPLFTDWDQVKKWQQLPREYQGFVVNFDDLASMIDRDRNIAGVVLNPFQQNVTFTREHIAELVENKKRLQRERRHPKGK